MSAAVNSIIGAQSDSIGRGTRGPEFGEESDSLESWAVRSAGLAFCSIAFKIAAPEVTSNRSSSKDAAGSESRIGPVRVRPPGHYSQAELYHAPRGSAARLAVARTRRRSSLRGYLPCSLSFQT